MAFPCRILIALMARGLTPEVAADTVQEFDPFEAACSGTARAASFLCRYPAFAGSSPELIPAGRPSA